MKQSPEQFNIDEKSGEYTRTVLDTKIYSYDPEVRNLSEMLRDTSFSHCFSEGLRWLARECGYAGADSNDPAAIKELQRYIYDANTKVGEPLSQKTLQRWITGKANPDHTVRSRNNVFLLMFVLRASLEQSVTFFRKYYYAQPFNFRSSDECVYYWCLKNGKTLTDVENLRQQVASVRAKLQKEHSFDEQTVLIGKRLDELENESEVAIYVASNIRTKEAYFQTAKGIYTELLEEAKQIAADNLETLNPNGAQKKKADSIFYGLQKDSVDFLLTAIFGTKEKILPDKECDPLIRENFPTKAQFSRCMKEDIVNAEILRKILILLMFFITYAENADTDLDSFYANVSYQLEECGFPVLYPADPYDRIFLTCVFVCDGPANTPLTYFREVFVKDDEEGKS